MHNGRGEASSRPLVFIKIQSRRTRNVMRDNKNLNRKVDYEKDCARIYLFGRTT